MRKGSFSTVIIVTYIIIMAIVSTAQQPLHENDEECHRCAGSHERYYFQRVVITEFNISTELEEGGTATVTATIRNDCNTNRANYNTFDYVDLTLSSENGRIDITDAEQRVEDMGRREANAETITWTVEGTSAGEDTLALDVHGFNPHKSSDFYNESTIDVTISPTAPNAKVKAISFDPANAYEGDTVEITATVKNKGNASTWDLTLIIDDSNHSTVQASLDLDEEADHVFSWDTTGLAGEHDIEFELSGVPEEEDLTDNSMSTTFTVKTGPDIVVQNITAPANATSGSNVEISVDIWNPGGDSSSFDIVLRVNGSDIERKSKSLGAGASESVVFTWDTDGLEGSYNATIIADPDDHLEELDEGNNEQSILIDILIPEHPDCRITSVVLDPIDPVEGDEVTITVETINDGRQANWNATAFAGGVKVDQVELSLDYQEEGSSVLTWNTTGSAGEWNLTINISGADGEVELDDNVESTLVNVRTRPDIELRNLSMNTEIVSGGVLSVQVVAVNLGEAPANSDVIMTVNETEVDAEAIDLGSMETAEISFSWNTSEAVGIRDVRIIADPLDEVWESNETNNELGDLVIIRPPPEDPDPAVFEPDIVFADQPVQGGWISLNVTFRNLGNASVNFTGGVHFELEDASLSRTISLPALGSSTEEFSLEGLWQAGVQNITAFIEDPDPANAYEENDEAVVRLDIPTRPDIRVLNASAWPMHPSREQEFTAYANITNSGGSDSTGTVVFEFGGSKIIDDIDLPVGSVIMSEASFLFDGNALLNISATTSIWEYDTSDNNASLFISESEQQDLELVSISAPTVAVEGRDINITANITNLGYTGSGTLIMVINGTVYETLDLNIGAYTDSSRTIEWTPIPGSHDIVLKLIVPDGDPGGNQTLTASINVSAFIPEKPFVILSYVILQPSDPLPGEGLMIIAMAVNEGGVRTNATIALYVDGEFKASRLARLGPDSYSLVTFNIETPEGVHDLKVRINSINPEGEFGDREIKRTIDAGKLDEVEEEKGDRSAQWVSISVIIVGFLLLALILIWRRK